MGLTISRRENTGFVVGSSIEVRVCRIEHGTVCFWIHAPGLAIWRDELNGDQRQVLQKCGNGGFVISRRFSEIVRIGPDVSVEVTRIRGGSQVRLRITAPQSMRILRTDVINDETGINFSVAS